MFDFHVYVVLPLFTRESRQGFFLSFYSDDVSCNFVVWDI